MENFVFSKNLYIFALKTNVMANIKTSEQLQAMFQASRERKEKEREEQKKQKRQQYQQLCKEADRLLKEDAERRKKEKMEQLQALAKQTSQNQRKYYITQLPAYIEENLFANITIQSRADLKAMEEKDEGKIDWNKWDELVNQTRQSIKDCGIELAEYKQPTPRKKGHCCTTYVYDLEFNLLGEFPTARKAEDAFGIRRNTISYYKFLNKPYKGMYFKDRPL